ncbi:hypothetical protein KI387_024531, partial [Taxus chinensis]
KKGLSFGLGCTFLGKCVGRMHEVKGDVGGRVTLQIQDESGSVGNSGVIGNGEDVGRRGDEGE